MIKINSSKFNFQFFLSSNKKVASLKQGALLHGGATKYQNGTYSNIQGNSDIIINDEHNTLSIFIPSTLNVNKQTNNSKYVDYSIEYIKENYGIENIAFYKTKGSWLSENNKVVYDDITIISFECLTLTESDIQAMINLANYIKYQMSQEGVSININSSLAII